MYHPFAASIPRRLPSRLATSALPDAPVLADASPLPERTVDLRGLAARRLVRPAGRPAPPRPPLPCSPMPLLSRSARSTCAAWRRGAWSGSPAGSTPPSASPAEGSPRGYLAACDACCTPPPDGGGAAPFGGG